ncbi:MAG TPA: amino acid adenylation domain-containing protein, partial [Noviherbaspirillum sp.]|nr:amino acid adenylation domain-containing protein [Noviherbaspirillum sp.]
MMTSLNAPEFSTLLELLQFRASDAAGMANNTAFTYLEDGERISGSITFSELDRQARHIATHLQKLTQPGDRVLVVYPPSLEYIVAFFACVYAGVIAVPALPPANARTLPRLQLIANDAQPRIALAPGAIVDRMEKLQSGASDPLSGLSWLAADRLPDAATHWVPPQLSPSDIAFLQYTSGSTGNPKGVMVSHANILANTALIHARFGIQVSEVVVSWLPPHHDMGLIGKILYPVYAGCHCVQFPPAAFLMRPYRWLKALSDYRARITGAPNFAYELCISKISEEQKQTLDLSALEFALNGAEPIRYSTLKRFAQAFASCGLRPEALTPVYGLAESTLLVSASTNKVKGELPNHQTIGKAGLARDEIKITTDTSDMADIVSVGATGSSEHHAIIVDPSTHAVLTDNMVGEIWLCGPSVAHGYWNRPEESRQTFAATVANRNAAYLRTGDLGFVHRNELYITGRIKEMMVFNGRNIYPQDVEATVERIDPAFRVNGCAVFSLEEGATAQLVIIQEIESRKEPLVAELLNKLRADLAEQHEIFAIEAILLVKAGHIPRTSSGKIQRRRCKELFLSNAFSSIWAWRNTPPPVPQEEQPPKTAYQKYKERQKKSFPSYKKTVADYIPPQTETEQRLARIWGEFLGIEKISSADNFFTMLGGHSLSATQVISKLRDEFGVELELRTIYDAPTLASLAQQIDLAQQQQAGSSIPAITPIERHGPLQLSFAQQRLWFLDQLESGSAFYNIPAAVRLTGQLDIAAFTHTLNEIVRRHEVLRTTFTSADGTPVQIIAPAVELALPITDLGNLPHSERETQAQCLVQKEAQTHFDLATGPLIRAGLLRLAPDEHILVLTVHHIVSDGWSMGILVHEIATLYAAYVQGLPSPLPALTIQYADFAHWQRQWLTGEVLQRQLSYWTTQLAGAPALLTLPTDRPRPPVQRYRGATLSFTVPQTTLSGLHALCKQAQVTLFMALTAAFNVLLSRHSGQDDICIGTAIANRNRAEIESLIGFFVNTLVLRTQIDRNATFYALLQQMRVTALGAYAHQDVPFEQLVDAIKPERHASHAPLFQVMLILQNAPMEKLTLPSLTLQSMSVDNATAKFDLKLSLTEDTDQLYGSFEYNTDLFDASTVQRMAGHFVRLLEAVAADSACRIDALPMQSSDERQHVLQQWNQAQSSFLDIEDNDLRMPLATPNLIALFDQAVLSYRARTAIAWGTETLDYGVLDARSNQIANGLIAHGATKGSIIAILLDDPVAQIVATLGVLKAGCVFASLNTTYPTQRLRDMCALVAPRWLISEAACIQQVTALLDVPEGERQLMLMDMAEVPTPSFAPNQVSLHLITQQATTRPSIPTMPDDPCYIYFTSGSTGIPKAVLGRTAGLAHFIQWEIEAFGLDAESRVSQLTPPTFDVYLRDIFAALCAGGTVCIPPSREVFEPVALANWIEQSGVTLVHCVPSVFRLLLEGNLSAERFASLRHILLAGEALLPADANRWIRLFGERIRLVNLYGPTETTLAKFYYRVPSTPIAESFIPVGKPIPGAQAILLKENLEPCACGEVGEIHIRTPYGSLGYYNRPDLNRAAFIRNPFTTGANDLLYRTGDLALLQPNGDFRFMGRKDAQVKIRGMRIEPGEIETALAALPGVRNAVVLAREDSAGDRRLAAYVVPHQNTIEAALDAAVLRKALSQMLPDYMVPAHFIVLDRLPLTPNGKVDRKALPAPDMAGSDIDHVAPRTPMEDVLASIWGEALRLDKVGVRHNFFHIGGHSLLATQLISRVRAAFQVELPLHALFEAPTIEALSDRIKLAQQEQTGMAAPDILPVKHGDTPPLSFAQQRLWFLDQFENGSAFYNIPVAMRLVGELDIAALARTLNEIVRRHEALRTTFSSADGNPVQVVASALEIALPVMDLTALAHGEREANAQWHLQDEAQTPFDLEIGPLIRARLIRLEQTEHIIALSLHHIVADAWSMGVLVREVAALYAAYRGNLPSPLPELPIQYADFAHWQRQWLSGDVLQCQLSYWTKQLADAPALLALPTDRPRPSVQRHNGAAHPFTVPEKTTAGLYALGRRAGATLFMTLTAAFNVLLSRYSGQTDICIGTPIANRNRAEIEALIGFFVNTLVLRSHVDSHADFNSLLQQVRATALGAYAHQDVPFERLVDALKPERHLSHSPLFQVMLVLQNAPMSGLTLPDLSLQPITGNRTSAKFDLTLYVTENDGQLSCSFEYDTDLFDSATIERMAGHFTHLLDAIIAAPEARLGD